MHVGTGVDVDVVAHEAMRPAYTSKSVNLTLPIPPSTSRVAVTT